MKKKVLLFPLANVLGHLSRTLALAEAFLAVGYDVYLTLTNDYWLLHQFSDSRITFIPSQEMDASLTRNMGKLYDEFGIQNCDLASLEYSTQLSIDELKRRGEKLSELVNIDAEIIKKVRPDVIVIDYHFAPLMLNNLSETPVFFISHHIGFPSLYYNLKNEYPYPFEGSKHQVLVPGIQEFEILNPLQDLNQKWMMCGPFFWKGWEKMEINQKPVTSDVLLFFGSTGATEKLTPWLTECLSSSYQLATVNLSSDNNFISLEFYLKHTSLVICHGGHETVMAAIRQKKPMIIIPNNLEQLEIGRRVQELSLGILINKPYQTIKIEELKNSITSLMANKMVQSKLDFFSSLIYQSKGAQVAAQFIDEQLELLKFNENIFSSNNLN